MQVPQVAACARLEEVATRHSTRHVQQARQQGAQLHHHLRASFCAGAGIGGGARSRAAAAAGADAHPCVRWRGQLPCSFLQLLWERQPGQHLPHSFLGLLGENGQQVACTRARSGHSMLRA